MMYLDRIRELTATLNRVEAHLSVMLKQFPGLLWTTDRELRFTMGIGLALRDLKVEPGSLIGHRLSEYFGTEDCIEIREAKLALEGKSREYLSRWMGFVWQVNLEPLYEVEEGIVGVLGVAKNITEEYRSKEMLQRLANAAVASTALEPYLNVLGIRRSLGIVGRAVGAHSVKLILRDKCIAQWGQDKPEQIEIYSDLSDISVMVIYAREKGCLPVYGRNVIDYFARELAVIIRDHEKELWATLHTIPGTNTESSSSKS